jgi:hypothetical protein
MNDTRKMKEITLFPFSVLISINLLPLGKETYKRTRIGTGTQIFRGRNYLVLSFPNMNILTKKN